MNDPNVVGILFVFAAFALVLGILLIFSGYKSWRYAETLYDISEYSETPSSVRAKARQALSSYPGFYGNTDLSRLTSIGRNKADRPSDCLAIDPDDGGDPC